MGLINYIRENLPHSWEKITTECRCKSELIQRIYAAVPRIYKNKYHYREGMTVINRMLKSSSVLYAIDHTDIDESKWNKIDQKIKDYEEQCR